MANRSGQWVILGMLACGLAGALLAVWYHYQVTRRSLEFWGPSAAGLIARAPQIEALRFEPPLADSGPISIDDLLDRAEQRKNVTRSRGILNVRQAFIEDSTFRWQQPITAPPWSYALVFSDGPQRAAILLGPAAAVAGNPVTGACAPLDPAAGADLALFFSENLDAAGAK